MNVSLLKTPAVNAVSPAFVSLHLNASVLYSTKARLMKFILPVINAFHSLFPSALFKTMLR